MVKINEDRGITVFQIILYVGAFIFMWVLMSNIFHITLSANSSFVNATQFYSNKNSLYNAIERDSLSMQALQVTPNSLTYSVGNKNIRIYIDNGSLVYNDGLSKARFPYINHIEFTRLNQFCYNESGVQTCKPLNGVLQVYTSYNTINSSAYMGYQANRGFYVEALKQ